MPAIINLDRDDHEPEFLFRDSEFFYVVPSRCRRAMKAASAHERLALSDVVIRLHDSQVIKSRFFSPIGLTEPADV